MASRTSNFTTSFVAPEIGVGRTYDLGDIQLRPSFKLRYTDQKTRNFSATFLGTTTAFSGFKTTTKEAIADLTVLRKIEQWDLSAGLSITRRNTSSDLTTAAGTHINSSETIGALKLGARFHATEKINLHGFIGVSQGTNDFSSVSGGLKVSMKF